MSNNFGPISEKCNHFIHGADYNPEQWKDTPEIWDEDFRLMQLANFNSASIGIFSWAALEPEEGRFDFSIMDEMMDRLANQNMFAVLATPSGARPAWLSQKYPEVLRVGANRVRNLHGERHNHCYTSPVYREKTRLINSLLAERYKNHPALFVWHISNEFGGECHCELCQNSFREWLKIKYDNNLDNLNRAWWTTFWSHTYTDWTQIESPAPHGEMHVHGLTLNWKRFVTYQTVDFMKNEIAPIREFTPNIPVTTNLMGTYEVLNYWKMAKELDIISWDNYPRWHSDPKSDGTLASEISFVHDINRSLKNGKPFMLMESTPSLVNWQEVNKLKKPGMHLLSSIQAVAHGADTVQYFQWRKSRGSNEKFHGAVVDHVGHEHTRVFKEVAEVGEILKKLDGVIGTSVSPEVAIIYDWENLWAINECKALVKNKKDYLKTCMDHYNEFWSEGVPVDIIDMDCNFEKYKLLIAPMLYMLRPNVAERIEQFVKNGGTLVTTYWSGIVDENDLCFLGGVPAGPLRKVTGIWAEEIDSLNEHEKNALVCKAGNSLELNGEYRINTFCELIHAETANVLATYKTDFYAGMPVLTENTYGSGKVYYIAARTGEDFLKDLYKKMIQKMNLTKTIQTELPAGVTAQIRTDGKKDFVFLLNFNRYEVEIELDNRKYVSMKNNIEVNKNVILNPYGFEILSRA